MAPGALNWPPVGSSYVLNERKSGSYGSGKRQVTMRYLGDQIWQGQKVRAFSDGTITTYVDQRRRLLARIKNDAVIEGTFKAFRIVLGGGSSKTTLWYSSDLGLVIKLCSERFANHYLGAGVHETSSYPTIPGRRARRVAVDTRQRGWRFGIVLAALIAVTGCAVDMATRQKYLEPHYRVQRPATRWRSSITSLRAVCRRRVEAK